MEEVTEDINQSICVKDKLLTEVQGFDQTMRRHPGNVSQNPSTCSKKTTSKTKDRVKTEFANQWLQFLSEKRKLNVACDPTSKLDLKDVRRQWWGLNKEDKQVYIEKALKEKDELGDNYRKKGLNEEKVVHENPPVRKQRKKKVTQKKAVTKEALSIDNQESLPTLMTKFKELEQEIEEMEGHVEQLIDEKVVKMVEVATKKANLEQKTDSISVLKDKIANMNRIHTKCFDSK